MNIYFHFYTVTRVCGRGLFRSVEIIAWMVTFTHTGHHQTYLTTYFCFRNCIYYSPMQSYLPNFTFNFFCSCVHSGCLWGSWTIRQKRYHVIIIAYRIIALEWNQKICYIEWWALLDGYHHHILFTVQNRENFSSSSSSE